MTDFNKYSEDKIRFLINLQDRYDRWAGARRQTVAGRLQWKGPTGQESLYRMFDGNGNGTSLGPRSAETQAAYEQYQAAKQLEQNTSKQLAEQFRQYRAFRLPLISGFAGDALRVLDVYGFLGSVQVVGTNALFAYQVEARAGFVEDMTATEDFDLSWTAAPLSTPQDSRWPTTIIQALKKIDSTYTINTERPFQALNAQGEEIELLLPADLVGSLPPREGFRPIAMTEQNWLLMGNGVDHVICDTKGRACRIVAPDPRYFALQKMWLSKKPSRHKLKVDKDNLQGHQVLDLVKAQMPHYPLDDEFEASLPEELKPYFHAWSEKATKSATPVRKSPSP